METFRNCKASLGFDVSNQTSYAVAHCLARGASDQRCAGQSPGRQRVFVFRMAIEHFNVVYFSCEGLLSSHSCDFY